MRRSIVLLMVFALLSSILVSLFAGALALADSIAVTRAYPDVSATGSTLVDPSGTVWDLTRGDLTVSYTLDTSGYVPAASNQDWSEVGVAGPLGQPAGWLSAGTPGNQWTGAGYQQNPSAFDFNDKLVLNSSRLGPTKDEYSYDTIYPGDTFGDVSLATYDLGSIYSNLWFDRGGASQEQTGIQASANTGGIYNVSITFHAARLTDGSVSLVDGTMFATVNQRQNMFMNTNTWQYVQVGKSFNTDLTKLQVYENIRTPFEIEADADATGAPASVVLDGVVPNSATQGDQIHHMYVNGFNFRDVAAKLELSNNTSGQKIDATSLSYQASNLEYAEMTIPEYATVGTWDTSFWHIDDLAGKATKADYFTVRAMPPKVTGVSTTHSRPNTTFTMTFTGSHFRNIATTLQLIRGGDVITAKNVKWVSSTQVKGDFTIPANAYIGADWTVSFSNADGVSYWQYFSVDAHVDVYSNSLFNAIWLRAPWIDSVVVYSEGNFDATTLFPLGCSFGGTFPIGCNPMDMNHDGRKDLVLYFSNMSVNLPVGTNSVPFDGATLGLRRIRGWDTVRVFKFLF